MKNIFQQEVAQEIVERINNLTNQSQPLWGTMNVAQMLAHCNVTYEMVYDNIHSKPNSFMRFILKSFVKPKVVSEKPYPKNSPTAPAFKVSASQDFDKEKNRLISYIDQTLKLGEAAFEGKESLSFGKLSSKLMEGDTTNFYIYRQIKDHNVVTSTIARGIAVGDELQYADEVTLGRSLMHRVPFETSLKI